MKRLEEKVYETRALLSGKAASLFGKGCDGIRHGESPGDELMIRPVGVTANEWSPLAGNRRRSRLLHVGCEYEGTSPVLRRH